MGINSLSMSFSTTNNIEEINAKKVQKKSVYIPPTKANFSGEISRGLGSMLMNIQNVPGCSSCGGRKI
jgi:hypothetical protein